MRPTRLGAVLVVLALAAVAAAAGATPRIDVRTDSGPHHVDMQSHLVVVVQGTEANRQPEMTAPPVDGAHLELAGVRNSSSSQFGVVGSQVTRQTIVRYDFIYRLTPLKTGRLEIGPFVAEQGNVVLTSERISLDVTRLPDSDSQFVRLLLPDEPVWVSRPFEARVEWWLSSTLVSRLGERDIRVPLLDMDKVFDIVERVPGSAESLYPLNTRRGRRSFPHTQRRERREGEDWLVVTLTLELVPRRAGRHTIEPSRVVAEEILRTGYNVLRQVVPVQSRHLSAEDETRVLEVRGAPASGRPDDFSGALGVDLALAVSADRTRVSAGEPVTLTLVVQGDTALETLSLPPALAMGLDPDAFSLTSNPDTGVLFADGKTFTMTVRPRSADVDTIPSLSLSWFDPVTNRFETTRSEPIALEVAPARTVGAGDVVRTPGAGGGTPRSGDRRGPTADEALASRADLAIETRLDHLDANPPSVLASAPAVAIAHLLAGGLAVAGLVLGHRRRRLPVDVTTLPDLAHLRAGVAASRTHVELAEALRAVVRAGIVLDRVEVDELLAACDAAAWRPDAGVDSPVDAGLKRRAEQVVTVAEAR